MLQRALTLLLVLTVAAAGLAAGWWSPAAEAREAADPLRYSQVREAGSGRTLLADDPGTGRIVEVIGDLDGAENVAVVVPGTGQNRGNFRTSDRGAGTVPVQNGEALYAEMRERSDRVAVVVWLGYRPPQDLNATAYRLDSAREGADELTRLTRDALPRDAHVTLACHSYGASVCGLAARRPGVADDVVALGAPGMGVGSASEIDARVWATRAGDDWIRFVPGMRLGGFGLGPEPVSDGFGATVFTDDRISGHEQYYQEGSASLSAIADIAVDGAAAPAS
ncbi:alpha/beta hydrolase [Nocardiopsis potens]|uniref:alpha/beta hydrolase n=1 Tax=Nocardiopsis potens TaxID=1246458 RepID=UPI00034C5D5F|nr:alpha/beta hydrolase [Nocardiopsis potens]